MNLIEAEIILNTYTGVSLLIFALLSSAVYEDGVWIYIVLKILFLKINFL